MYFDRWIVLNADVESNDPLRPGLAVGARGWIWTSWELMWLSGFDLVISNTRKSVHVDTQRTRQAVNIQPLASYAATNIIDFVEGGFQNTS